MNEIWIFAVGGLAQFLFSARTIIQWLRSEKAGKVLTPNIYWHLSLTASLMLLVYGILRDDLVIILGQFLAYFIYIRNLQLKNVWRRIHVVVRLTFKLFPVLVIIWILLGPGDLWQNILFNRQVTVSMLTLGTIGQVIFSSRFLFQWYFSEKRGDSILPPVFWIVSLTGSILILFYGALRHDPVLILGQSFGIIVYLRNLILHYNHLKLESAEDNA